MGQNKGKFFNQSKKQKFNDKPQKKLKTSQGDGYHDFPEIVKDHPAFQSYYKIQFKQYFKNDPAEFNVFWGTLKQKLPIVFRINCNIPKFEAIREKLHSQQFLKTLLTNTVQQQSDSNTQIDEQIQDSSDNEENEEENEKSNVDQKSSQLAENQQQKSKNLIKVEELDHLNLQPIQFYPHELVWQLNVHRYQLQQSQLLQNLHKYINRAAEVGIISRQQLVSMLPPLFLDIQKDEKILDMCAAPGSKTAQLLEMLYSHENPQTKNMTNGFVIANDVDRKRAHMLIHQLERLPTAGMMVLNHPAQFYPSISIKNSSSTNDSQTTNQIFQFDQVLADVPCTGDAATRKIPEHWKKWNTNNGMVLHPLQYAILCRAIGLTQIGGMVLYSTCSLNPIENEAVVTQVLRRAAPGSLELVDIHNQFPGLQSRRGLNSWKVCISKERRRMNFDNLEQEQKLKDEEHFVFYQQFEDAPQQEGEQTFTRFLRKSMFPEDPKVMTENFKIENTMRILPHDHNSGGFFLALFKQNATVTWRKSKQAPVAETQKEKEKEQAAQEIMRAQNELDDSVDIAEEAEELQNQGNINEQAPEETNKNVLGDIKIEEEQKVQEQSKFNQINDQGRSKRFREDFVPIDEQSYKDIVEEFGLQGVTNEQLVSSSIGDKKIRLVSKSITEYLQLDETQVLNQVNIGCQAFERIRDAMSNSNEQISFRICQDGIQLLFPHITKRQIKLNLEQFQFLSSKRNLKYEQIPYEDVKAELIKIGTGSTVFYIIDEVNQFDCFVVQNFRTSINLMISKFAEESFKMRYD